MQPEWIKVTIGNLNDQEVKNIAREIRGLIDKLHNVYPNGDRTQRGQMKVTRDQSGQYCFYLNHQALVCMLLFCKDLAHPFLKQEPTGCPPEVPDFLRWGTSSD
jgi:hypothetical protein